MGSKSCRPNATSFRYSQSVSDIISRAPGHTFADRIEHICIDYKNQIEIRQHHLSELDHKIQTKQLQYNDLANRVDNLTQIVIEAEHLVHSIKIMNNECSRISNQVAASSDIQNGTLVNFFKSKSII